MALRSELFVIETTNGISRVLGLLEDILRCGDSFGAFLSAYDA